MKWMGVVLGLFLLMFLGQNWQPWLPLIILGQPVFSIPFGLGFLLSFSLGILCSWGLDRWVKVLEQPKDEPIVLEPDDVEYPRRRPSSSEEDWDFADDWD
jgi:hypothetical protein